MSQLVGNIQKEVKTGERRERMDVKQGKIEEEVC